MFDRDNSGFITASELKEVLDPLTDQKTSASDWKRIVNEIDINGDGQISFDEFKQLMKELIFGNSNFIET